MLYRLHGIGGDKTERQRLAQPGALLEKLVADGKTIPIIVINDGRAQKNNRAEGNSFGDDRLLFRK